MTSRKFIVTLLILAIGVVMAWFDHLSQALVDLLKWTGGLYFGFNVSQKAAEWFADSTKKEV